MTRQRRRTGSLVLCGLGLLSTISCQQESKPIEAARQVAAQHILTGDSLRVALIQAGRDRGIDSVTAVALATAGTFTLGLASPLVDDEQAFQSNSGGYEADVLAFPIDNLAGWHSPSDFSTPHSVALLQVKSAVGSSAEAGYKALKLGPMGFYCVYLQHAPSAPDDKGWSANVAAVTAVGDCKDPAPTTGYDVHAFAEGDEYAKTWNDADTPPSVRFVEGKNKAMFLGVRCGKYTCIVGTDAKGLIKPPDHAGPANDVQTDGTLWHDEQALSDMATSPKPKMLAAVIPDANLANLDLTALQSGYKPVGRVEITGKVLSTYKSAYGFSSTAPNYIFIKLDPADPVTGKVVSGRAMITNDSGTFYLRVKRMDHGNIVSKLPATARWKWTRDDEEIWVRCDIGCCMVEPGIS